MKPHALFDFLKKESELKSDADLSRALKIAPPVISKIRANKIKVGAEIIIRVHLQTEMPIKDIFVLLKENQDIKSIYEDEMVS